MKMHELDQSVTERVTIGPDGKVTGGYKPQLSEPVPAAEPAPAAAPAPSNVKPSGSTVEYGGSTYSVNVFGDGMRPRIGRSDKVVTAKVYILGDKMYVLLDPAAQEGLDEESKGLYYNVNKRKKAGTSRPASSPKAPTAQAWKDAAKTAKKEGVAEGFGKLTPQQKAHEYNLDSAQREMDRRHAQGEDMTGAKIDKKTYKIVKPKQQGVAEAFENDESNMMYRFNSETGRLGQRMIHNNEEQVAHRQGYRDSHESALKVHGIIRSKFKPGKWVQKQGNSWAEVHPFGKPDGVDESATAGATSAANVGVGAVYNNKPPKQPKNKDGTAKNAVDMKGVNLLTGGSLKR
jgi:hypothetical protein